MKTILTILFFTYSFVSFGHKDRISFPKTFVFVFKNMDTVKINGADKDRVAKISADIVNKKIDLISAEIIFQSGEKVAFSITADKWTSILVVDGNKVVPIPARTLDKIPAVHFETFELLWDGNSKKAFSANYFYLRFDIEKEKDFYDHPHITLIFENLKYKRGLLTRQMDKDALLDSDF